MINLHEFAPDSAMLKTLLNVGLTVLIAVFVDNLLRSLIKVPKHFDNRRARRITTLLHTFVTIVVYAFAAYIILSILGLDLTPLLASATFIAIIGSIGARPVIEDFATGLFLMSLDTIAVGDYIKTGDTEGYIESINPRTLQIRAETGALHIIPNSQVKALINYSRRKLNLILDLPVKANQDVTKVIKAAEEALNQIQKEKDFSDAILTGSRVNGIEDFLTTEVMTLRITIITSPAKRWEVGRQYRLLVKKAFEKDKLEFA